MHAVGVIIYSADKTSILLSKRSANEEDEIGKWENVGGKLESGESYEEAVIREVREELGVAVTDMKEELVYGDPDSDHCVKLYSAQIDGEPRIMEPFYCDELKWFNIAELGTVDLAHYAAEDYRRLGWI